MLHRLSSRGLCSYTDNIKVIMDQFIGVKLVQARPMHQNDTAGYAVRYGNGYESWSPEPAFKDAYQSVGAMSFGVAFEALRMGHRIRRPSWEPESYVFISTREDRLPRQMLIMHVNFGGPRTYHWVPSETEALACDWQLIEQPQP